MRHFCKHGVLSGALRVLRGQPSNDGNSAVSARRPSNGARQIAAQLVVGFHHMSIGIDRRVVHRGFSLFHLPQSDL